MIRTQSVTLHYDTNPIIHYDTNPIDDCPNPVTHYYTNPIIHYDTNPIIHLGYEPNRRSTMIRTQSVLLKRCSEKGLKPFDDLLSLLLTKLTMLYWDYLVSLLCLLPGLPTKPPSSL